MATTLAVALLFATNVVETQRKQGTTSTAGSRSTAPFVSSPTSPVPSTVTNPTPTATPTNLEQWFPVGRDIDGEDADDQSGYSVALSSNGTVLAVGAWLNSGGGAYAGHTRVFTFVGGEWVQLRDDIDGVAPGDRFGFCASLSDDGVILAVGAPKRGGAIGAGLGQVRVLGWTGATWEVMGSSLVGEVVGGDFGEVATLSRNGNVLAVGKDHQVAGGVKVFAWNGLDWLQRGTALESTSSGDHFSDRVSFSWDGSVLAGGAFLNDENGRDSGSVRVFRWNGTAWNQLGITLAGLGAGDLFGSSGALSGDGSVMAVGTPGRSYCIVYAFDGKNWFQIGQTINGVAPGDSFGYSLAMSKNGDTVLIGGFGNDDNGLSAGHAQLFRFASDGVWAKVGQDLVGEFEGDQFGFSVAISGDARRIAVGGRLNDGNGNNAGRTRVFELL